MSADGNWVTYACWIGEDFGLVSVDVELAEDAPRADVPHSVSIEVAVRAPNESGLPDADELDLLHGFEAALADALDPLRLVGHTTAGGVRTTFLYTTEVEAVGEIVRTTAARVLPEHEVSIQHFEDPAWEQYLEFLYPNKLAWRYIYDNAVLASLQAEGDDSTAPRPIDHTAFFPSRDNRRSFAKAIEGEGYVAKGETTGEGDAPPQFSLKFQPAEDIAPGDIHAFTERLELLAEEHGGAYDGWGCVVVKADDD